MSFQDNSVKLNVGGTIFETSKSTLTRFDGFFKTMLETGVPIARTSENCIFIDRDPIHFRIILNFMRDGDVDLPDSEAQTKEISREANFYLLEGLMELCKQKLKSEIADNELVIPKNVRILETYDQVLQLSLNPQTPIMIVYYTVENYGQLWTPYYFNFVEFMEKYNHLFKIYFKKAEIVEFDSDRASREWQFDIFYKEDRWSTNCYRRYEFLKKVEEEVKRFANQFPQLNRMNHE